MSATVDLGAVSLALEASEGRFEALSDKRFLETLDDGTQRILGGLSRSELKTAFVLNQNVAAFFARHPLERIGFLTLTFDPTVKTPREANRRFDSFNSNYLRKECREWVKVTEPHKDGRPHFHLLLAFDYDIRTGFDFEAFSEAQEAFARGDREKNRFLTRRYSSGALPSLRRLWAVTREACGKYGVGRSELLPIRKEGEAATRYVGKYIEKGGVHRVGAWKGARLTSYSHGFKRAANTRFSWVAAKRFREYAAQAFRFHGVPETEASKKLGPKWAHKLLKAQANGLTPAEGADFLLRTAPRGKDQTDSSRRVCHSPPSEKRTNPPYPSKALRAPPD